MKKCSWDYCKIGDVMGKIAEFNHDGDCPFMISTTYDKDNICGVAEALDSLKDADHKDEEEA